MTTSSDYDLYDQIQTTPPLTKDQECELFRMRRSATPSQRQKIETRLLQANMRFAMSEAKRWSHRAPYHSLRRAAMRGLGKAIAMFDETHGHKLITYAVWWMHHEMSAEIVANKSHVKLPRKTRVQISQYWELLTTTESATAGEILDKMQIPTDQRDEFMRSVSIPVYLDEVGDSSKEPPSARLVSPEPQKDDYWSSCWDDPDKAIDQAMTELSDTERQVLVAYYGLHDSHNSHQADIAREIGVSRERIRQIRNIALKKVGSYLRRHPTTDLRRELQQMDSRPIPEVAQ